MVNKIVNYFEIISIIYLLIKLKYRKVISDHIDSWFSYKRKGIHRL